jgi:catechol 2,3-dioxygenase-like lactoylglutathione lyase family enzyme
MKILHIDHFVLTVKDIAKTCEFYQRILGMEIITFANNRKALKFGKQKINLHQIGQEFEPKAKDPTSGSADQRSPASPAFARRGTGDFCLITETPIEEVIKHCQKQQITIELGIVARTGANGEINSIYIRDPDRNLIEIANYLD